LQTIFDYIEIDSPKSALVVDSRICDQTDSLAEFPEMRRPGRLKGARELTIDRTPYIAVYCVDEFAVTILRVMHGAQLWPPDL